MCPVIFNPPFMQNQAGYGFRKVVVMSDKQIRKQRKIKDEIMTSNSWKMTEVLRNLRNRNK